jgi:hypothetical protein
MNCKSSRINWKKTTFFGTAIAITCGFASATKAATLADISFIIDTSGSMSSDIDEVRNRIIDFDRALVDNGIDARYGLTLFADGENFVQNLTDFSTFNRSTGVFQTFSTGGATERGSLATQVALNNTNFRSDSVKNFILITDEDDDSSVEEFNSIRADLGADDTSLFNFIGVPGTGNTDETYGVLASENGGSAFNIAEFRSNPEPFFDAFINTKVQEIIDNAPDPDPDPDPNPDPDPDPDPNPDPNNTAKTPEPMSILGLLSFGLIGLIRRKKIGL